MTTAVLTTNIRSAYSAVMPNTRSFVAVLFAATAAAAVVYCAALYIAFDTGFAIKGREEAMRDALQANASLEVRLRARERELFEGKAVVLESMERVTALQYLERQGFVANKSFTP